MLYLVIFHSSFLPSVLHPSFILPSFHPSSIFSSSLCPCLVSVSAVQEVTVSRKASNPSLLMSVNSLRMLYTKEMLCEKAARGLREYPKDGIITVLMCNCSSLKGLDTHTYTHTLSYTDTDRHTLCICVRDREGNCQGMMLPYFGTNCYLVGCVQWSRSRTRKAVCVCVCVCVCRRKTQVQALGPHSDIPLNKL